MNTIYGVDPTAKVTPLMVREAIKKCFFSAHCEDTGIEGELTEGYCEEVVRNAFRSTGGDFEHPTKESIQRALENLADFSKNFRKPEIVKKHFDEIQMLVSRIEE